MEHASESLCCVDDLPNEALAPVDRVGADKLAGAARAVQYSDHVKQVEAVCEQKRVPDVRKSEEHAVVYSGIA
jgi:hypothetical protein